MSMSRAAVSAAAFGAALGIAALGAYAVTAGLSTNLPAAITEAAASRASMSTTDSNLEIDFMDGDVHGIRPSPRSPSEGTLHQAAALHHSVSAAAEARYVFGGRESQSGLLFEPAGLHNSDDLVSPGRLGFDAVYVQISDASFDAARMSSSGDAFEFTNIFSLAAIPVPASLPFLLGGLLGLRLLTRRRRADQA